MVVAQVVLVSVVVKVDSTDRKRLRCHFSVAMLPSKHTRTLCFSSVSLHIFTYQLPSMNGLILEWTQRSYPMISLANTCTITDSFVKSLLLTKIISNLL